MKRTQQSVLLAALALLSLSACQYIPWRLTSAMPPATNPPVTHGNSSTEAAPAPSTTVAPNSTSEKSSTSTPPSGQ